ncbi:MAG TPA: hypothetical protein VGJ84_20875, partial [Polyangiaceae bacterium]
MRSRFPLRWLGAAAWLFGVLATSGALAQTVTLPSIEQSNDSLPPMSLTRCLENTPITFHPTLSEVTGLTLEVWATRSSSNCQLIGDRQGSSPQCWLVYRAGTISKLDNVVPILPEDIIGQHYLSTAPGSGTCADCTARANELRAALTDGPQDFTLWFILFNNSTQLPAGQAASWKGKYDFLGPAAPTGVTAGVGENQLVVGWKAATSQDTTGYRIYCSG